MMESIPPSFFLSWQEILKNHGRVTYRSEESMTFPLACLIESRVECIEVSTVKLILYNAKSFPKALEVNDFPCAQELDSIIDIRIVFDQTENVIVGCACLLLCCACVRTTSQTKNNTSDFEFRVIIFFDRI